MDWRCVVYSYYCVLIRLHCDVLHTTDMGWMMQSAGCLGGLLIICRLMVAPARNVRRLSWEFTNRRGVYPVGYPRVLDSFPPKNSIENFRNNRRYVA